MLCTAFIGHLWGFVLRRLYTYVIFASVSENEYTYLTPTAVFLHKFYAPTTTLLPLTTYLPA